MVSGCVATQTRIMQRDAPTLSDPTRNLSSLPLACVRTTTCVVVTAIAVVVKIHAHYVYGAAHFILTLAPMPPLTD